MREMSRVKYWCRLGKLGKVLGGGKGEHEFDP